MCKRPGLRAITSVEACPPRFLKGRRHVVQLVRGT
jgi:hypothetical protein